MRHPHLDPLPGNGEAGLLCQVGVDPFLVGGGLAPSLRENLIDFVCGSRDPVEAAVSEAWRQAIRYPRRHAGMLSQNENSDTVCWYS